MGDDLTRAARPGRETSAPAPPAVLLEQDFDVSSLYALRAAVAAHAAEAGLAGNRLYDVVTTAHELAANAVRHGAGQGRLRLWAGPGVLHCEVSDTGRPAPADGERPAGRDQSVAWQEEHGHGLWVIGRVADQFVIDRSDTATTATADFALAASPEPEP